MLALSGTLLLWFFALPVLAQSRSGDQIDWLILRIYTLAKRIAKGFVPDEVAVKA